MKDELSWRQKRGRTQEGPVLVEDESGRRRGGDFEFGADGFSML